MLNRSRILYFAGHRDVMMKVADSEAKVVKEGEKWPSDEREAPGLIYQSKNYLLASDNKRVQSQSVHGLLPEGLSGGALEPVSSTLFSPLSRLHVTYWLGCRGENGSRN